jgi:hypothetical protein
LQFLLNHARQKQCDSTYSSCQGRAVGRNASETERESQEGEDALCYTRVASLYVQVSSSGATRERGVLYVARESALAHLPVLE